MKKQSENPKKTYFKDIEEEEEEDEEIESSSPEEEIDEEEDSDDSEEDEDDDDDDAEAEIERELADVTFGELQKARSDGSSHSIYRKLNLERKPGRANKNRPMEASSKKPVGRYREVIQVPKKVVRDPRFESLCGKLDVDGFRKRFDFLFENNLPAEREDLKRQLKKTKDQKVIADLKQRISWIDKQLKFESAKSTDTKILAEHKKKEREAAKHGKKPYYLKQSEIRKQKLIEKYNTLKASGKLESYLEKKRRKNAAKDHRYMPYRRPHGDDDEQ